MLIGLAGMGCAKRESRYEQSASDSMAGRADSSDADRAEGPSPAPVPGAPIGRNDSLINAIAPKLAPWVAMWQSAMPAFKADSLYRVGVEPAFRKGYVQPLKNVYPPTADKEPVYLILSAHSPDGRYNLIFDWYQHIGGSADDVDIGGEPDSAPLLLDLRRGISNMFDFSGPGCRFLWGTWLSPTDFVLAGWRYEDQPGRTRGWIKVYSLDDSTSTAYVTRLLSTGENNKYRAAWEEWVESKYRALKPTTPRS